MNVTRADSFTGLRDFGSIPPAKSVRYIDVVGYHLYVSFNLKLSLSASGEFGDGSRYLRFINALTQMAQTVAPSYGVHLLEVQNDKLHFILLGDAVETEDRLVDFAEVIHTFATNHLAPIVGGDLRSMKYCATNGRAIIVSTGINPEDSTVSLGPAANDPAKRLASSDIQSGELHYRFDPKRSSWKKVSLRGDHTFAGVENHVVEAAGEIALRYVQPSLSESFIVTRAQDLPSASVVDPYVAQGFYMRCDLDGFTQQVKDAFASDTEENIDRLVQRFVAIMGYADHFADNADGDPYMVAVLPWAGDCANTLVLPSDRYDLARKFVPPRAAARWFTVKSVTRKDGSPWADCLLDADWLVSLAGGGDGEDESNGFLLIADIQGVDRKYRIAAGWGAHRSLSAQGARVVRRNDTVLPDVDHHALDKILGDQFTPCSNTPTYYRANGLDNDAISAALGAVAFTELPIPNVYVPPSKPYHTLR